MKTILPWVIVLGLAAGVAALYTGNQKQAAQLAIAQQQSAELQALKASAEESAKQGSDNEELNRLRKEHEDLLRLRNEVRQLREEKTRLNTQVQTAQAQAQNAQAQVQTLRAAPPPLVAGQSPSPAASVATDEAAQAMQKFRERYGLPQTAAPNLTPEQQKTAECINNLRQIDGAKEQWALEKSRPAGGLVGANDLAPYFKNNGLPTCPAGGAYTISPIGTSPYCNIPGHVLSR